jgi:hypothetical protein
MIVAVIEFVTVNFREICKSWASEKRQSVERMIDTARLAATKKTIEID